MENDDKRTKCSNMSKHLLVIRVCARRCSGKMVSVLGVFGACDFAAWKRVAALLRGKSVLMGDSLSRC